MKVRITTEVLDAMDTGMHHDLVLVSRARKILEAAGLQVEIHPTERDEIDRLRRAADKFLKDADEMAARLGGGA